MGKPRILVFASGTPNGGGSGFENLVLASQNGILDAKITAVVSNNEHGRVRERADRLHIPFFYFPKPWTKEGYRRIARALIFEELTFGFITLSGWLKLFAGLNQRITFNIHPGPLPGFGGPGMYGHHVHEAVLKSFLAGKITHSAVSMHFVTEEYDKGPVFLEMPVDIHPGDTADDIAKRVNEAEHYWQPRITNLVVHGKISWDGKNPESLRVPEGYQFLPRRAQASKGKEI